MGETMKTIKTMRHWKVEYPFFRHLRVLKLTAIALLSAATPVLAEPANHSIGVNIQELLQTSLTWVEQQGPIGIVSFVLIYIISTVVFFPGTILTLGAGVIFGIFWGSLYVFIAATIGAVLAFLVGRYLARDWVARKIEGNEKFAAIDKAVSKEGFKIVFLTRLSPAFPFVLLNYAYGLTGVSLKDYFWASFGMIPGTVMYVYIGSLATSLAMLGSGASTADPQAEMAKLFVRIIGFIATVAVTVYVTKVARKALQESVSEGT
jgi:uncharacterized membrane protein YdjX (TVP38/TMEM64 family)